MAPGGRCIHPLPGIQVSSFRRPCRPAGKDPVGRLGSGDPWSAKTGPWINFDVRPEHQAMHGESWSWGWVWFAAIMAILGIAGVLIIWIIRLRRRNKQ